MEVFEVHITWKDSSIIEACKKLKVRAITIELLKPDKSVLRKEYMTSHVFNFLNFNFCLQHVARLKSDLEDLGVEVVRVKVEVPAFYRHYEDASLYMESHFQTDDSKYPLSRSSHKDTCMGTERTYRRYEYESFRERNKDREVELCLLDTNMYEDKDWFDLYKDEELCSCVGYTVMPGCPRCNETGYVKKEPAPEGAGQMLAASEEQVIEAAV